MRIATLLAILCVAASAPRTASARQVELTFDDGDDGSGAASGDGRLANMETNAAAFGAELESALSDYYQAYNRDLPPGAADSAFAAMTGDERIEFGILSEGWQERIIRHVQSDSAAREAVHPAALDIADAKKCIDHNRCVIGRNFSLERYGENLARLYESVAASPVEALDYASAPAVLEQFLDPGRFNMLRT